MTRPATSEVWNPRSYICPACANRLNISIPATVGPGDRMLNVLHGWRRVAANRLEYVAPRRHAKQRDVIGLTLPAIAVCPRCREECAIE